MKLKHQLRGRFVTLRNVNFSDAHRCVAWLRNPETNRYLKHRDWMSLTHTAECLWIAQMHESKTDLVLAICIPDGDVTSRLRHVGNVAIHHIDHANGHGELGAFIGDTDVHGRGVGQDALYTFITHAFTPLTQGGLGLYKVWGRVYGPNIASRTMSERVGLVVEGILRGHCKLPEGRVDEYRLAAFAHSWVR